VEASPRRTIILLRFDDDACVKGLVLLDKGLRVVLRDQLGQCLVGLKRE
jgi:hypothetical protein